MELNIDLHTHTDRSFDCRTTLVDLVNQAKLKGLDGIAVCDHDVIFTDEVDYSDFLIIPGIEFSTEYGHLLGLFIESKDDNVKFDNIDETIDYIHSCGGIAVLPHPYMRSSKVRFPEKLLSKIDAVEIFNSRAERKIKDANRRAIRLAAKHSLPVTAGSDAHFKEEVGNAYMTIEAESLSLSAVKEAILRGENGITGDTTSAMNIARSNRIKIVRLRMGLKAKLKWGVFAAFCFMEDMLFKK